uniref:NADH dehydrogenase subunit 3 n=1 Tax=Platystethus dilutipennis TaxID=3078934 RepID=UPI002A811936|nr:NADH dehydrogenase subunit 3 [Platystethus dilutipennis]WON66101.1 NADH dehydrogenase subunit 3 [Platystethus dilutipennis]
MMIMMLVTIFILFMLSTIMMLMSNIISKKTFMDREKNSPFECGFDPKNSPRLPFSLHFFLIAIIFLIFDIELTLLIPFIMTMKMINLYQFSYILVFFIIILLIGLFHEWNQGALNWIN